MASALTIFAACAAVLATTFLLARPLALIAGAGGALFAAFRFVNALYEGNWVLFLRDFLLTTVCAAIYWAILILTR